MFFMLAVAGANCAADETTAQLKARVEKARPEDRPELCIRIAQQELHVADNLYVEGHVDGARAAVNEIVAYFEEARDAAVQTKTHLKNVEIAARKVSVKLSDIKRTLAFDDQAPVEQAVRRLEDVRTVLLKEMFSDKKKGGR
jgi:hypothetical protein